MKFVNEHTDLKEGRGQNFVVLGALIKLLHFVQIDKIDVRKRLKQMFINKNDADGLVHSNMILFDLGSDNIRKVQGI